MKIKGARVIIESLLKEGVDTLFCYPGGQVISIFDELHSYQDKLNLVLLKHEQSSTHAADAYSRTTGKVGTVLVTSGPGATNTVTGIANAYMDSVPMVVITGQVKTFMIGTDAFQEADITGITSPITKANFLVTDPDELAETIKMAYHIARTGRPGPVLIDIPSDIQTAEIEYHYPEQVKIDSYRPKEEGHARQIKAAMKLINQAEKPLVVSGGGVIFSDSAGKMNEFIDLFGIPVVNTLMGHGLKPADEGLYLGPFGMHGSGYGNYAVQNADLIIAAGVRFCDRVTGKFETFAPNAKIIHIDVDPAEIGKNIKIDVPIVGNVRSVLKQIVNLKKAEKKYDFSQWINEIKSIQKEKPLIYEKNGALKPQFIIEQINRYFPENTILTADVGQNQMWISQFHRFKEPRSFVSSSGLGTMGFSLPASIGAKIGNPDREVISISGDGGFQMNLQELISIKNLGLNIKIIVLDNQFLGMVKQWQQLYFEKRYMGTELKSNPDFAEIAKSIGIQGMTVKGAEEAANAMKILAETNEAMLIHAFVDPEENVLPMVPVGYPIDKILTEIKG